MLIPFLTKKIPIIESSTKLDILSPFLKTQHEMIQNLNSFINTPPGVIYHITPPDYQNLTAGDGLFCNYKGEILHSIEYKMTISDAFKAIRPGDFYRLSNEYKNSQIEIGFSKNNLLPKMVDLPINLNEKIYSVDYSRLYTEKFDPVKITTLLDDFYSAMLSQKSSNLIFEGIKTGDLNIGFSPNLVIQQNSLELVLEGGNYLL